MHSPHVGSLLATPQSRLSIASRKISFEKLGGFNINTPQSAASVASTSNTIEHYRTTTKFGRYGGYMALFGGFLFQLTLGAWFCFGNLIPYVASYMAFNRNAAAGFALSDDDLEAAYNEFLFNGTIVFFIAMVLNGLCCIFGGSLELQLGPTKTLVITGLLTSFGFGATYFGLVWDSMAVIYLTFGVTFGAGVGLGYPVQPIVCMRWFPEKRGVVNGFTSAVFGAAPFIFNPMQSKLVNPTNVAMNDRFGFTKNQDIVERIPIMFIYVGAIFLAMQAVSLLMIRSPPWFVAVTGGADAHVSKSQLKYEAHSLTVRQSLGFWVFWSLFLTNLAYTTVLCWLTAQWKVFSFSYMGITDDGLLSIMGSICALSNGVGRFFWGVFYDYTHSFRISQGLQSAICTVFVLTLPFIKIEGEATTSTVLLTIWMVVMWGCAGCNYSFIPSCLIETFGAKHVGELIGIFILAEPMAVGFVVFLSSFPFLSGNFEYYVWIVGCCSGLSIILTILTRTDTVDRKEFLRKTKAINRTVNKYDAV